MSKFDEVNSPLDVIQQALYAAEWHPRKWCEYQALALDWATQPRIDQVAVVYTDEEAKHAFVEAALNEGWTLHDSLLTHEQGHLSEADYDVRYEELRDPDNEHFSIVVMMLGPEWLSVLHHDLLSFYGQGCVAHASFRPHLINDDGDKILNDTLLGYQSENTYLNALCETVECYESDHGRHTYFLLRDTGDMMQGYLSVRWVK